jgi:superfamily II DNA or RNA helicase
VAQLLVLRGQSERALELRDFPKQRAEGLSLFAAFWAGDYAKAARIAIDPAVVKKGLKPVGLQGVCELLALVAASGRDRQGLAAIRDRLQTSNPRRRDYKEIYEALTLIRGALDGERRQSLPRSYTCGSSWLSVWTAALHDVWIGIRPEKLEWACKPLRDWSTRAAKCGYDPIARELAGTVEALTGDFRAVAQGSTLAILFRPAAPWESALLGLDAIVAASTNTGTDSDRAQLIDANEGENPLQVVCGRPRLVLVAFEPPALPECEVDCEQREDHRMVVHQRASKLARVAQIVGEGLEIPEEGLERLARTLARLCIAAGADIEGDFVPEFDWVVADARPLLLLDWDGEVLTVRACVAPLGLEGPHLRPGDGDSTMTADLRTHGPPPLRCCQRDLGEERRRFEELRRRCPTLSSCFQGALDWRSTTISDALEVLLELGQLGEAIVLAWPRGRKLHPPIERDLQHLKLAVSSEKRDWFGVDVGLELDEGKVLSFRHLVDSRAGARFVKLGENRFLALSDELRRRLDAFGTLADEKSTGLKVTTATLPLLEHLTSDLDEISYPPKALAQLRRIRELANSQPPRLEDFRAELHHYQEEGFAWAWRLAEGGLGGCLADEMGLGKTVQTLALLSARASKGPALVVCPTSVLVNWIDEASRFAPNLRARRLDTAGDRGAALAELGRGDLVVCSYGLLVRETEKLAAVEFATAVFDEAHLLKNSETDRVEAARAIQADFRLGLTGTPIENRVEELWSLFDVLVPGLLGSKVTFDERFAIPIAEKDSERIALLRQLLNPFVLRRTKSQVLHELPPRIESIVRVRQQPGARAFYETLRGRALESVKEHPENKGRLLAEITRLRQAAVDPRLVERAAPAGAKINTVIDHVLELRAQGHRGLVFTQFLGGLALLRERFTAAGIEYLEIEGSTSPTGRALRVGAFQRGHADVFLISLRAGGVGLNLTAADYVLHLDPWWNPAVEDQATDRAHRIGQTQPVTVYRFITEGSIEEKILNLHQSKRALAEDILSGLEGAKPLCLDELKSLI